MNTLEYLAELRAKYPQARTTYAMAKLLKVTPTTASRYDKGQGTFDDAVARRVAELLNMHPGFVLLDMQKERAQSPESKALWQEIFQGFLTLLPRADWGMAR